MIGNTTAGGRVEVPGQPATGLDPVDPAIPCGPEMAGSTTGSSPGGDGLPAMTKWAIVIPVVQNPRWSAES